MLVSLRALLLAGLAAVMGLSTAAAQETMTIPRWDSETVSLFASLPVQDGGRIKPLDTYAQFAMLKLNGKRSFTLELGEDDKLRLGPTEWLLYCLFYPEVTDGWKMFIVDNVEAVKSIGIATHEEKRDRYAYVELAPGRAKLMELARSYAQKDAKQRLAVEQQILNLAHNLLTYEDLRGFMSFADAHIHPDPEGVVQKALGDVDHGLSAMLAAAPRVLMDLSADPSLEAADRQELSNVLRQLEAAVANAEALDLFPPSDPEDREWMTPGDLLMAAFEPGKDVSRQVAALGHLERLKDLRGDPVSFHQEALALHENVKALAQARGEYAKVPVERAFYQGNYLFYSQWLYVLSFVLVAISWLAPQSKWLRRAIPVAVLVPTVLLVIAITLRCIIRGRPPVTTLYETILFITASSAITAMIVEYINPQRIAIALGSFLGMVGMFIAYRYEVKEAVDTMPSLVAVLDTNFWLATHVTTVTLGYAAGLLAAALAHVYIFGKLVGFRRDEESFYAGLGKMVYGVVCFCLLFSLVGTVLGGIWANDSWGRFWGWDPKENGALMICLWSLVMLHGRLGRYIGDLGMAVTSVILGMIVAFSWWGVNLLGVGLHSYGFTSGIMRNLVVFWALEAVVVVLGLVVAQMNRIISESKDAPQT